MRTFVGLDCGGSSSRALAVDESGTTLFRGQGGSANLLATPADVLERSLREATEGCPIPDAVCGAFAGLVGERERQAALDRLAALFPSASLRAEPDYAAAHAAAPVGTEITVIAGTGSLVCGHDLQGRLVKSGGGGYLLGDEGSGYRYGRATLAQYINRPEEGPSRLAEAVLDVFGTADGPSVLGQLYAAPSPQSLLARLFPAFARDLDEGEDYAEVAAARECEQLAETVARHAGRYLPKGPTLNIALTGGIWKAAERLETLFRLSIESRLPQRRIRTEHTVQPPIEGAVALAKEQLIGNGN